MNIETFTDSKIIENLGWSLLHSVWQMALISFVLFLLLKIFRTVSANCRYLISVCALGLAFVLFVITFTQLSAEAVSIRQNDAANADFQGQINTDSRRTEDFSLLPESNQRNSEQRGENTFASVANLQTFFNQHLPAVLPLFVGFWFFGIMFFAFRLSGGVWQLHIYKTREISAPNGEWLKRFTALCEKFEITQTVKFLQSNLIETPVVIGWLKPIILVPASVFLQINPTELETILAHELIHIRRYDALVNLVQNFIEILFFYHPCVWWISSVIRNEREFAADEAVIKMLENSHIIYANALANLEEFRLSAKTTTPSVLVAANGGNLMQRITKILQKNTERKRADYAWSAMLALALLSAVLLAIFSFNQTVFVNAQTKTKYKKIAVGFVSIPPVDRTANPPKDSDATARLLIEKLKSHKVPAIGFLQGGMISDGEKFYPARANIARLWRDAGFEIGIGNFKHIWFYDTPYDEYVANVEKNESVARKILAEKNLELRYFSYPYLNTGKNAEERSRFEMWLGSHGLSAVKYTIDNQEWIYSYAYDMARNDNDISTMNDVRAEFVKYMSKMFDHYEAYSNEMFGRDINQTMVLTSSRLVADSADDLFGMIEKRGYQFVSMEEALKDEAYQTPENFYGKSGISWFERWQMAKGKKLLDEPEVSDYVQKIWDESRAKAK